MICSILASTSQGGIGNKGTLPWPKHKEDLAWFKKHTTNQIVVMGRNTWEDPFMPKPLPNRTSYIVSRHHVAKQYQHQVRWIPNSPVENILQIQEDNPTKDVYVIGGRQLYEATENIVQRVYLTRIKENYWTDTRVQLDRMLTCFQIKSVKPGENCTYETWDRVIF
jgi:dihydrofolate reductase